MSTSNVFLIIGLALLVAGLVRMATRPKGGEITLKNFGINFGGSNKQVNKVSGPTQHGESGGSADRLGLITAIIGLITALVSLATSVVELHKG